MIDPPQKDKPGECITRLYYRSQDQRFIGRKTVTIHRKTNKTTNNQQWRNRIWWLLCCGLCVRAVSLARCYLYPLPCACPRPGFKHYSNGWNTLIFLLWPASTARWMRFAVAHLLRWLHCNRRAQSTTSINYLKLLWIVVEPRCGLAHCSTHPVLYLYPWFQ